MTWDQQPGGDHRSEPGIDRREAAIFDAGNGGTGGGGGDDGDGGEEGEEGEEKDVSELAPTLGDDRADHDFVAIHARYSERIVRFFRLKVPSNSIFDAEELGAEVFRRLFEKLQNGPPVDRLGQRFEDPSKLVFGIAKNVLYEHLRKVTKIDDLKTIARMSIAQMGRSFSSQVSRAQKQALVHEGMRELPFYQHLVLDLCVYHEMSYKDTSSLLGLPLGTVASLRSRAEINLKKWLGAQQGQPTNGSVPTLRAAYPWYDPSTGAIDHGLLVACVTRAKEPSRGSPPEWYVKLEIPGQLPNATPQELFNLVRGVWEAWIEAGRPQ